MFGSWLVGGALHVFSEVGWVRVVGHVVGELFPEPHQPVGTFFGAVAGNVDGDVPEGDVGVVVAGIEDEFLPELWVDFYDIHLFSPLLVVYFLMVTEYTKAPSHATRGFVI